MSGGEMFGECPFLVSSVSARSENTALFMARMMSYCSRSVIIAKLICASTSSACPVAIHHCDWRPPTAGVHPSKRLQSLCSSLSASVSGGLVPDERRKLVHWPSSPRCRLRHKVTVNTANYDVVDTASRSRDELADCPSVISTDRGPGRAIALLYVCVCVLFDCQGCSGGLDFNPYTHTRPTDIDKPVGITTESPYPQNHEILHTQCKQMRWETTKINDFCRFSCDPRHKIT